MTVDDLRNEFDSGEDDLRDIQDILDDPTLDEAEKLDAIAEVADSFVDNDEDEA
jgi:hypothetical protein